METSINVRMVPQGLLVPRTEISEWLEQGVEAIKEKGQIVIRPKPAALDEREDVIRILEEAGLLLPPEPLPEGHIPVSDEEKAELACKFSIGRPLSEIVIEERDARW